MPLVGKIEGMDVVPDKKLTGARCHSAYLLPCLCIFLSIPASCTLEDPIQPATLPGHVTESNDVASSQSLSVPDTSMLWLASAMIVGLESAVKIEKSRRRDLAARLTRSIITNVRADIITIA